MCFRSGEENWLIFPSLSTSMMDLFMGSMLESDRYNNLDLNKSFSGFGLFFVSFGRWG